MIGILSQNDNFHFIERRSVEGVEYLATWRVAGILLSLSDKKLLELCEIRCLELRLQHRIPTWIKLYAHTKKELYFFSLPIWLAMP